MDQDQSASTELTIKSPTTLENIPEDVAEIIAEQIQGWAKIEGSLEHREKARRLRDSALRAVAALQRDGTQVPPIQSLCFKHISNLSAEELHSINSQLASMTGLKSQDSDGSPISIGILDVLKVMYGRLGYLRSLFIMNGVFMPSSLSQLSCLSTTLKKVYIPQFPIRDRRLGIPLNARNVVWLLSFSSIEEAALGFTISKQEDFKFLVDHHNYFSGTSNVKKLSLTFEFVYKRWDRKTWWGLSRERKIDAKNESEKTEAIALLLEVVNNQFECLELYPALDKEADPDDECNLSLRCLLNLRESLGTLQHLRLVNCFAETLSDDSSPFPLFRSLKTISLESNFLYSQVNLNPFKLPVSLERIILAYYLFSEESFDEEKWLAQVIKSQYLPNLTEVVVPSTAVGTHGSEVEGSYQLKLWAQRRRELENEAMFKSGKVRLTKADKGCSVIPDSQTFMSHLRWLSPPF